MKFSRCRRPFYRYPADHRVHVRTTNQSTFATVRLRTKVTKGPGSRTAGIAMTYKLIDAAHTRWRAVNAAAPGRCRPYPPPVAQGKAARTTRRPHARRVGRSTA